MHKTLLIAVAVALLLPSPASAAIATVDTERRQGTTFGRVIFKGQAGERNLVTITEPAGDLLFHDEANPVHARGDCEQVNARTARCPLTEDGAEVRLGNGDDRADVVGVIGVFGGSGDDLLRGSGGFNSLHGQGGADRLIGKGGDDSLTAGPGSDTVLGGRGDDDLIDGETDARGTADVFRGGASRDTEQSDRGDLISYSMRNRALEIRLSQGRARTPDGDVLQSLESVTGGAGNDRIVGDRDDNWLSGGGGKDYLQARHGADNLHGDGGNDRLAGGPDDDGLAGDAGRDRFDGHGDDDFLIANDSFAERVVCNLGRFDVARVTRIDTVDGCEIATSLTMRLRVRPEISGDTATFQVACGRLGGCSGTLELNGPAGQDFGSSSFADLPDDPETFSPVTVELTAAAVEALVEGVIVQVAYGETGGFRAFMQSE
jgi:Ca2+-binding RTX toxin-like protein